jgi:hypothetical protein
MVAQSPYATSPGAAGHLPLHTPPTKPLPHMHLLSLSPPLHRGEANPFLAIAITPASARCPSHSISAISVPCACAIDEHRRLLLERAQPHREPSGRRPPEVASCQEPDTSHSFHYGGVTGGSCLRPWPTPTTTTSSSAFASATFPNRGLSTPTIGRPPSPPPWSTAVVSPRWAPVDPSPTQTGPSPPPRVLATVPHRPSPPTSRSWPGRCPGVPTARAPLLLGLGLKGQVGYEPVARPAWLAQWTEPICTVHLSFSFRI